jgi:sec-independent protein translocase protein TatB
VFGIGFGEFIVILFAALVVVGPAGLPKAARTLGRILRAAKRAVKELSDELDDGLDIDGEIKESGEALTKIKDELKKETRL